VEPNSSHASAYRGIFEQYVEQASFLWILRSIAVKHPHYTAADISDLERRIEAQLDGLMTSIDQAWEICLEALEIGEQGEVFTAAVIAFKSHDSLKIQKALEAGLDNEETFKALVSVMGWLPDKLVHPWIKKFLASKDLDHKHLALAACSVRRKDPGEQLNQLLDRDDCKAHERLYARALRLIGELKRKDLMSFLVEAAKSDSEDMKFWSNWSAILLGDRVAVKQLEPFIFNQGPHQINAIEIAFRSLPVEQARSWISRLVGDKQQIRAAINATGIFGDPHAVNWLIKQMQDSTIAKLSGEAFNLITGINLEQFGLALEDPPDSALHPNEDIDDEDVSLDEDENLPWPDFDKVSKIWADKGSNFTSGQRYFMGRSITTESLKEILFNASQRQRHAAALELALVDSEMPFSNTCARVSA
jgi:uncharacterized protein (TIGR02270 family)